KLSKSRIRAYASWVFAQCWRMRSAMWCLAAAQLQAVINIVTILAAKRASMYSDPPAAPRAKNEQLAFRASLVALRATPPVGLDGFADQLVLVIDTLNGGHDTHSPSFSLAHGLLRGQPLAGSRQGERGLRRSYAFSVDRHCSARWANWSYSSAARKSLRFRFASHLI